MQVTQRRADKHFTDRNVQDGRDNQAVYCSSPPQQSQNRGEALVSSLSVGELTKGHRMTAPAATLGVER